MRVSSLLLPCGLWAGTQVIRLFGLGREPFCLLSPLVMFKNEGNNIFAKSGYRFQSLHSGEEADSNSSTSLSVPMHTYNRSTWGAKAGRSSLQGQPGLMARSCLRETEESEAKPLEAYTTHQASHQRPQQSPGTAARSLHLLSCVSEMLISPPKLHEAYKEIGTCSHTWNSEWKPPQAMPGTGLGKYGPGVRS